MTFGNKRSRADLSMNFSAGPSALPPEVIEDVSRQTRGSLGSSGSILELSDRSERFRAILRDSRDALRKSLAIPVTHEIIFMQGGASLQFLMAPLNLAHARRVVHLVHTDHWTGVAAKEMQHFVEVKVVASGENSDFRELPNVNGVDGEGADFVYCASNNTAAGTQFSSFPNATRLVADMSSDLLSRKIDVNQFDLIFACAQKNLGIAGLTVVIIRTSALAKELATVPHYFRYSEWVRTGSQLNTAPVVAVCVLESMLRWIGNNGGVEKIEESNQKKAQSVYQFLDRSTMFRPRAKIGSRSLMNATFELDPKFASLSHRFADALAQDGITGLKGHPSVGGYRISLYNAIPPQSVSELLAFMTSFERVRA